MLSKELKLSLQEAQRLADEQRHRYVTLEHLLYALCHDRTVRQTLLACQVNVTELRRQLYLIMDSHKLAGVPYDDGKAQPTRSVQRVLQRAAVMAQSEEGDSDQSSVNSNNVLLSLFDEEDSHAVYLLNKQGVHRIDIINYLASEPARGYEKEEEDWHEQEVSRSKERGTPRSALQMFARFLNEGVRKDPGDPLIGREKELNRIIQVLLRQRKNNPILIGESGTGKTAMVQGLALAVEEGDVPEPLAECEIYALDLASLVAGTRYRGDFERRMKQLINELQKNENALLFIDEIHTMVGAGAASNNSMDVSNLLKPALADGHIRFIGATTYEEYNSSLARDRTLARRFQRVDIREISPRDTEKVLEGLRPRLEKFHQVHFSQAALKKAIRLSGRYIPDRFQPDKSIDVLDEAGAYQKALKITKRKKLIKEKDIAETVARMTDLPLETLTEDKRRSLAELEDNLRLVVFGQEEAVHQLAGAVKLAWAGLNHNDRPLGCYLLAGPTGVGKTEMCRQLARLCAMHFVRFDMSEYSESHSVSRLLGAPPGYVGYDSGSLLTSEVVKNPHSVILFDEMEKAHPDVYNLLLQIMDYGVLTDNHGKKADFRNGFIIGTTNGGAEQIGRDVPGFIPQDLAGDEAQALARIFSPEFRNRLDAIIQFNPLSHEVVLQVVDKFLTQLQTQVQAKGVRIKVSKEARDWLAAGGYDAKLGARPLERLIKEKIKLPLANMMLFGELATARGTLSVSLRDKDLKLRSLAD